MSKLTIPFLAAAGLVLTAATSQAQSVGVEIGRSGPVYGYADFGYGYGAGYDRGYYGYRATAPARRSYGTSYGYRADEPMAEERGTPGGCGTYFYWSGDRCVDARNK